MPSCRLLLLALLLPTVLHAQSPADGFEPSFYLVGHKVKLNGTGTGKVGADKSFTAGLYLVKPARTLQEAQDSPGPKSLRLQMQQDIDSQQLGTLLSQVLNSNVPRTELYDCLPGLAQIGEAFGAKKRLAAGDRFSLDSVMHQGTQINVNGQQLGMIKGPAFFNCILKGYLGDKPSDAALKKALLNPPPPGKG